jgi:DNA repair exonuclease SbcCD ATPase subunit
MLIRILAEIEKYGSVPELVRQLNLNKNLEERNHELQEVNDALTRTRDSIQERIQEFLKQEAEANKRRDDLLEENKSLERQVNSKKKELAEVVSSLAEKLNTMKEWETIQQRMQEEVEKLQKTIVASKTIIAPAYWVRSILERNRPTLFKQEKEYVVEFLQPEPSYKDETGQRIIDCLLDELKRRGTLVPKLLYDALSWEARRCADNSRGTAQALHAFVRNPEKMTPEQRKALLLGVIECEAKSKEKFDELLKQTSELGIDCPIHHIKLSWIPSLFIWRCLEPNCTFKI